MWVATEDLAVSAALPSTARITDAPDPNDDDEPESAEAQ